MPQNLKMDPKEYAQSWEDHTKRIKKAVAQQQEVLAKTANQWGWGSKFKK